jgi:hypothetical protein|nr:MAG TPA: Protein of unknown function DUF262 [Caudoviricetes sp.]
MKDIKTTGISVKSVLGKINSNKYNFDLAIQRRAGIWKTPEKSLFIDTILREYPVYPALLNKHSDTQKVDVVDFKQRFNTLYEFANDKFRLSDSCKPVEIDGVEYVIAGKKFKDLDEAVQSRFNDANLVLITMTDATPDEVKEVFFRINQGHPLTNGHKRTAIESDEVRDIIYELASHPFLEMNLTQAQCKRNADRDVVIQVLMLTEASDKYDFGSFRNKDMNRFILYYNNLVGENGPEVRVETLTKVDLIKKAMNELATVFDDDSLRIKLNTLPFVIYGMYRVLKDSKPKDKYLEWLGDFLESYDTNEEYKKYCTNGTANPENVKGRLNYFIRALRDIR